jgi:hypothetical protein
MDKKHVRAHIVSNLFKMLCWREEDKKWLTIHKELILEISFTSLLEDSEKAIFLLKIAPLEFMDFKTFRQKIFEVINYVESIERL